MPSKIRKPSVVLRPGEMDFALRYAQSLATKGTPGFAGATYNYPSSALSAIVAALQAGHLAPATSHEMASVRDKDHKLLAVIASHGDEWVVEVSERRTHLFTLLGAGWELSPIDRRPRLKRQAGVAIQDIRAQIAQLFTRQVTNPPPTPTAQAIDLDQPI